MCHLPDCLELKTRINTGHNFFDPQPENGPAAFLLKDIIHNWGDSYSLQILKHLRAAASQDTKLLIVGIIIQYLCPSIKEESAPLLPTYGICGEQQYMLDLVVDTFFYLCSAFNPLKMMMQVNAREHTAHSLNTLLHKSGWQIDEIHRTNKFGFQITVASPIHG
jgi:hypothetical protein